MNLKTSNFLVGVMLIGSIAHLMLFMNHYWNDIFWMTAILTVCLPLVIKVHLQKEKQRKKFGRLPPKEI